MPKRTVDLEPENFEKPSLNIEDVDTKPEIRKKRCGTLVYIGPTIPKTGLVSGRVFVCGAKSIDEALADDLREHPIARDMFVTPQEAAEARRKINGGKTALSEKYRRLSGK